MDEKPIELATLSQEVMNTCFDEISDEGKAQLDRVKEEWEVKKWR